MPITLCCLIGASRVACRAVEDVDLTTLDTRVLARLRSQLCLYGIDGGTIDARGSVFRLG